MILLPLLNTPVMFMNPRKPKGRSSSLPISKVNIISIHLFVCVWVCFGFYESFPVNSGYRKEHVDIDISEDRTRISIGLQKQAQEDVKSGRSMKKKKVFRIPDGVDLSRIKAKFNELESILRIEMPKLEKGVVGVRVEEVKEEEADKKDGEEVKKEGADIETPQIAQAVSDEVPEKDGEKMKGVENPREIRDSKHEEVKKKKKEVDERERSEKGKGKDVGGKSTPEKKPAAIEKSNLLRTPLIIVGSALLVSIVLLAINRIRNRKR